MSISYYKTLRSQGEAEIIVKRSLFIGHARPVETEEEAIAFIEEIKRRHKQAAHNCSAYAVGDRNQRQKASDDGEPGGTAGKPILEVIKHRQLQNTAIVVTRYFGGMLLGAGGLVRAYTDSAVAAVGAAGEVYRVLYTPVQVTIDYSWLGKVENELRSRGIDYGDLGFADKVSVRCYPLAAEAERFAAWMTDLTAGQGEIRIETPEFLEREELPQGID